MRRFAAPVLLAIFAIACGAARPVARVASAGREPAPVVPREAASDDAEEEDGEVETTDVASATIDDPCPRNMALVGSAEKAVCVDKYEGALVELMPDGTE